MAKKIKNEVFKQYIIIVIVAILSSTMVFYLGFSKILVDNTTDRMLETLNLIEIDFADKQQIDSEIIKTLAKKNTRLTIIDLSGNVLIDSDLASSELENHLERKEVKEALTNAYGSAIRYSNSMHKEMFYIAQVTNDYIFRLAIPYNSFLNYLPLFLPMFLLACIIALILSLLLANHYSKTITNPLKEISQELNKVRTQMYNLEFKDYQFEELSNIVNSIKKMNEESNNYLQEIIQQKRIREEFFSNASHELKTPITSIKGYAELLQNGLINDEAGIVDCYKRIGKESEVLNQLINDILTISKLESSQVDTVKTTINLSTLINEIIDSFSYSIMTKQLKVSVECPNQNIYASSSQLEQIIRNLLSNAIKYNINEGQVELIINLTKDTLFINVADSGIGISEEDQKRIFERFYRANNVGRDKKINGTGLGLAIVKHIVMYYQGKIDLTSKLSVGTMIKIELPRQELEKRK